MEFSKKKSTSKAFALQIILLFPLLFTLVNPAGFALAQVRRVLIVENVEKVKTPKIIFESDKITLQSAKTGKRHKGRITALTDSSVVLREGEFLLRDINYIDHLNGGKVALKVLGWSLIPVAAGGIYFSILAYGYGVAAETMPYIFIGPALAGASVFLITRKAKQLLGPETGWILRIKRIE